MRFIGCKERLLDSIHSFILEYKLSGQVFWDFFSGTTCVARYFKEAGYQLITSDLLYFSYVFQKAYIENNTFPTFSKLADEVNLSQKDNLFGNEELPLLNIIEYLNKLHGIQGFIYKNYSFEGTKDYDLPRMYFRGENAKKIDAIRNKIQDWQFAKLLTEYEYFLLVAALVEAVPFVSNISGVYAAYLKTWDPRAYKKLKLIPPRVIKSKYHNKAFHGDAVSLRFTQKCDILYVDPPYNERQYLPNYHILETIARWDSPEIRGKTGMRNYSNEKSVFCNRESAIECLGKIATEGCYKHFILSYNSEGIMSEEDICKVLSKVSTVVKYPIKYRRFKSNSNGLDKSHVHEMLYYVRKG